MHNFNILIFFHYNQNIDVHNKWLTFNNTCKNKNGFVIPSQSIPVGTLDTNFNNHF